jgi:Carboxypeptidase regulatory-like domain
VLLVAACSAAPLLTAQPRPDARQSASVVGTVVDSLSARALSGATVRLVRQDSSAGPTRTTDTDALGQFQFRDVRPGQYLLGFAHPVLDDLGFEPTPVAVVVTAGRLHRTDLALPSAATLRTSFCGESAVRDAIGMIVGYARRDIDRSPLDSVMVSVSSRDAAADPGSTRSASRQRRVAGSTSGWFVMCGPQPGDSIVLSASRNGARSAPLARVIPSSGMLQQDLLLSAVPVPAPAAVVASRDSVSRRARGAAVFTLSGTVVMADGGRPIAGAIVRATGGAATRSDAQGAWQIRDVAGGPQTIAVRALRYAPLNRAIVVDAQLAPMQLAMTALPGMLDTVSVVDDAATDRNLTDFLERRRTRGSGTFLSELDIESRRPTLTSDLFRTVQGGIRIDRDSLGNRYLTMQSNTFRSERCLPAIFLDGMSLRGLTTQDLDGLVQPRDLFGIEVYRAANTPVEFSEQDGCGTVLLWTKR